jgi:hypothetical protein
LIGGVGAGPVFARKSSATWPRQTARFYEVELVMMHEPSPLAA